VVNEYFQENKHIYFRCYEFGCLLINHETSPQNVIKAPAPTQPQPTALISNKLPIGSAAYAVTTW